MLTLGLEVGVGGRMWAVLAGIKGGARKPPGNTGVSVYLGCCNKIPQARAYTTEIYFSQFWKVWFQVRAFLLACKWLPSSCILTWPVLCVCVCVCVCMCVCVWREREREGEREKEEGGSLVSLLIRTLIL